MMRSLIFFVAGLFCATCSPAVRADERSDSTEAPTAYPLAVLPFQERGDEVKGLGSKVTDLLFASLLTRPDLYLVDREDLSKTLQEQELNISGAVNVDQATRVGQLTGAKILVTGSVMQIDNTTILVAKIIGTETTRVLGASVKDKGDGDLSTLAEQLGNEVGNVIAARSDQLVAKPESHADRIAKLNKQLGESKRPNVRVTISERHVGRATIDPAVETEVAMLCKETGFTVLDNKLAADVASDVIISGEGFSEFSGRLGNLCSVKARVEIKAVDRKSGKVLAVDRQTTVVVDLSEQIAGKSALQQAGAVLAERLLPKLVAAN